MMKRTVKRMALALGLSMVLVLAFTASAFAGVNTSYKTIKKTKAISRHVRGITSAKKYDRTIMVNTLKSAHMYTSSNFTKLAKVVYKTNRYRRSYSVNLSYTTKTAGHSYVRTGKFVVRPYHAKRRFYIYTRVKTVTRSICTIQLVSDSATSTVRAEYGKYAYYKHPVKAGYAFLGWSLTPDSIIQQNLQEMFYVNGNATYYANWGEPHTFSLYVPDNDGNNYALFSSAEYYRGCDIDDPDDGTIAASHLNSAGDTMVFMGWFTEPNGTGEKVPVDTGFAFFEWRQDTSVYAYYITQDEYDAQQEQTSE